MNIMYEEVKREQKSISLHHAIGDYITIGREVKRIIAVHIYIGTKPGHMERYLLGHNEWYSIHYDD